MSQLALSKRRVAKNALTQVLSLGLATTTFAIAAVAVARLLGPRGLGTFSPAWQLAVMLSAVALLGNDQRLIRELNRGAGRDEISSTLGLGTVLGATFGVLAAVVPTIAGADPALARAFAAAGVYVAIGAPAIAMRSALHARERMELETAATTAEVMVALAGIPAALALGGGAAGVIGALAAGRLVGLAVATAFVRRLWGAIRPTLHPSAWGRMIRTSLPLGVAFAFTSMLLRFDVVLVGALRPAREAGIYAAAAVVTFAVPMVVSTLNRSLYPVLSRAGSLDHPELRAVFSQTWRLHVHVGLSAAAAVTVLAGPAVTLVYGRGFDASARVLAVLAWLLPVRLLNSLCSATLNATDWRRRQTAALATAVALNVAAMAVLIPRFGYWGAVWATAATEMALLVVFAIALHAVRPRLLAYVIEGAAMAGVVATAAAWTPGHVVVRTAVSVAAFGALFIGVRSWAALGGSRGWLQAFLPASGTQR